MADVLCPHCGMPNAPTQNVCSFCRQPLREVEGDPGFRPGESPTKKTTADLEPVLPAWLRDVRANARRADAEKTAEDAQSEAEHPAPPKETPPDLLAGLASAAREDQDDEIPDWMRGAAPVSTTPIKPEKKDQTFPRRQEIRWENEPEDEMGGMATTPIPTAPESGDALLPWMRGTGQEPTEEKDEVSSWLDRQEPAPAEPPAISPFASGTFKPPGTGELTDWLDKASAEIERPAAAPETDSGDSLGKWLSNLPRDSVPAETSDVSETFQADINLPDWMKPAEDLPAAQKQEAEIPPLPDWMKPAEEPPAAPSKKMEATPAPDWMASLRGQESSAEANASFAEPGPEVPRAPAFVPSQESLDHEQAEELFSVDMPDWLSNIAPTEQKPEADALPGETAREQISPADLPSWVQAMRPVETVLPDAQSTRPLVEGPMEDNGPLAGLRGVLPLGGLIQPGKPKAHAIRLQVSEAQQADASLLEQMLAAETQAEPLRGGGRLVSQRILRWVISALLILLVSFLLMSGSRSVPLPVTLPEESSQILSTLDTLPEGAPLLMIFDYEPALAGELEAAAAPLVDRVLGLRHPRVTILSTSPTGAALAERFFANTQARHNYQREQNYINLGYLPGGTIGILSFAENPLAAMPSMLWATPAAQDVNRFADFAAILLLTDQAETARAWVEQTASHREGRPLLVVSSAQAAPMIQPYLFSGQVNGLVSGLRGGAAFESTSGVESPVRIYWDTYNFATLFAALLIVLGGLWNWIAGARARQQGLGEI